MAKKYESTHPWLSFHCDLRGISHSIWMNLGAAQSKCKHVSNTLLPPAMLDELQTIFLTKGVMATTAIEGNSMTEEEVRAIIEGHGDVPKSREYQKQEVLNIVAACNSIVDRVAYNGDPSLSFDEICELNRMVLRDLPPRDGEVPGEIPTHNVVVGRYRGAPREDCEFLLRKLCDWINSQIWRGTDETKLAYGIIRAILTHLYFAWIHPFSDGNGRTARLLELKIVLASGAPVPAAHLLSSHYNQTRAEYYRQLDQASRSGGDVIPFVEYAVQGIVEGLEQQIAFINGHQWQAIWKEYVYAEFGPKSNSVARRQRQLALDLWENGPRGMLISKIRSLSPDVAECYANRDAQTIIRDIRTLEAMGLVERIKGGKLVRVKFHKLLEQRKPWAVPD